MAITLGFTEIVLAFFSFLFEFEWRQTRNASDRNWPVLLQNARRIHEYATQGLTQSGWTYNVKGPSPIWTSSSPRKIFHSLIKNNKYESALVGTINKKVENGLIPVLDHASELEKTLDLQEVFQRFTFDNICQLVLGSNLASLSVGFPPNEYEQAYNKFEEAIFYRQIVPESC
ncbi:hypothetical protein Patl1_02839 [Pistacia atlantica]|uniref:Uncharacterized protein n=1 Tax=Pistacia atlantica TaxID=434234 RepID=A0ACC1C4Y4_9ROSI|nr:hypothetical protein Patl1_02839 [Pistacia atlantica]